MTRLERGAAPPLPAFVEQAEGLDVLLHQQHPAMPRTLPLMVMSAKRVVESGRTPVISLGVLDKQGRLGRLTGGYYRSPTGIFQRAMSAAIE